MGEVTNQRDVLCVRLLLGIPLCITILYALYMILNYELIIMPFQYYILVVMIGIAGFIIFLISRASFPLSDDESIEEYFNDDLVTYESVFVIPTKCPKCQTPIKLDRVWWEDEFTPLCQECQTKIKLRIVDR